MFTYSDTLLEISLQGQEFKYTCATFSIRCQPHHAGLLKHIFLCSTFLFEYYSTQGHSCGTKCGETLNGKYSISLWEHNCDLCPAVTFKRQINMPLLSASTQRTIVRVCMYPLPGHDDLKQIFDCWQKPCFCQKKTLSLDVKLYIYSSILL